MLLASETVRSRKLVDRPLSGDFGALPLGLGHALVGSWLVLESTTLAEGWDTSLSEPSEDCRASVFENEVTKDTSSAGTPFDPFPTSGRSLKISGRVVRMAETPRREATDSSLVLTIECWLAMRSALYLGRRVLIEECIDRGSRLLLDGCE
jgi:hypothetical protein